MVTPVDIETALRARLPDHLHHHIPILAHLLADTANSTPPKDATHTTIAAESAIGPLLQVLAGQEITIAGIRISFTSDFRDQPPPAILPASQGGQVITAAGGSTIENVTQELKQFFIQLVLPSSSGSRRLRNRKRLLASVKEFWIEGVLENSLHGAAFIDLGFASQPNAVSPVAPFGIQLRRADSEDVALPAGTTITEMFDRFAGRMLILGGPGSGKTTVLLELCRLLLTRAEQDASHALPMVFSLASWSSHQQTLAAWLIKELGTHYQVPRKVARSWIKDSQIAPLLDGLDEVAPDHRNACVAAINAFLQHNAPEHLVVTSRRDEFEALTSQLNLQGSVDIQPLNAQQIVAHFRKAGAVLAGAETVLRNDRVLQRLVRSPLMLSMLTLAYKNLSASQLPLLKTEAQWREHLFRTYTEQMLARPGGYRVYIEPMSAGPHHHLPPQVPHYRPEHTIRWLTWIAKTLVQHNEVTFYIERMQPNWLPMSLQRWYYALVASLLGLWFGFLWEAFSKPLQGVAIGLLWGVGVAVGGESWISGESQRSWRVTLIWTLLVGMLIGFFWGASLTPIAVPVAGIVGGLAFGMVHRLGVPHNVGVQAALSIGFGVGLSGFLLVVLDIGLPDQVRAALEGVGLLERLVQGLVLGIGSGLLLGGPAGFIAWLFSEIRIVEKLRWSLNRRVLMGMAGGVVVGFLVGSVTEFVVGLLTSINVGLLTGLLGGLTGHEVAARITPNQGIWRSAKNAFVCFSIVLLAALLLWIGATLLGERSPGQSFGLVRHLSAAERATLRIALFGGFLAALFGGLAACLQHVVLRCFLYYHGGIPWNYARFLDYATNRVLLRKVGGGYMFLHGLLLDYFARTRETTARTLEHATTSE